MPNVTGCSAAWLAHLLWEQGVVGSNPTIPTIVNQKADERDFFHQLFFCMYWVYYCTARLNNPKIRILYMYAFYIMKINI